MEQADLIWHNGELVAWEDAKVHVLTHGLHYGTGVFEGERAYETAARTGDLPPSRPSRAAVALRRALLHAGPLHAGGAAHRHPRADRRQRAARVLHPPDRVPRLRPDGAVPARLRGVGVDRRVAVGRLPRRGGQAAGHPRQGVELAADLVRLADPARQGLRPVPQQRAGQDRGLQGRLPGGDPARLPRLRVRGLGREHLRRARRSDPHAAPDRRDPRRHQPRVDHDDRPRPRATRSIERDLARAELFLADEVFLSGTAAELVPVREIDDHAIGGGERAGPGHPRAAAVCSTTRCTARSPATRSGSTWSSRSRRRDRARRSRAPRPEESPMRPSSSATPPCATACRARACRCRRRRSCASPTGSTSSAST